MAIPQASDDELRQVHAALRITVPFEQMSPFLRHSLQMVAHCWRGRVPAHLWPTTTSRAEFEHYYQGSFAPTSPKGQQIDFKRRAAGDFE